MTGTGYAPRAASARTARRLDAGSDPALRALLEAGVLCNDAQLVAPDGRARGWRASAIRPRSRCSTVADEGRRRRRGDARERIPARAEMPFDPDAKMMATQHGAGGRRAGADQGRARGGARSVRLRARPAGRRPGREPGDELRAAASSWPAGRCACSPSPSSTARADDEAGFAAFAGKAAPARAGRQIDPPRPEVRGGRGRCRAGRHPAGDGHRRPQGDRPRHRAGARHRRAAATASAVDGRELEAMTDAELGRRASTRSRSSRASIRRRSCASSRRTRSAARWWP